MSKRKSTITKLLDGSGCFTAIIMSKEEAMKLPLEKRPLCFRISSEMYMAVWEAIGSATNCFKPKLNKREFNKKFIPEKASNIVVDLCFKIAEELEKNK